MSDEYRVRRYRKRLMHVFGRELAPSDEVPLQQLAAAEKRLGFALPSAVADFYLIAGAAKETRAHNRLLDPEELVVEEGFLLFMEENQGVVAWGMRVPFYGDTNPEDPEVWQRGKGSRPKWYSEEMPFSDFIVRNLAIHGGVKPPATIPMLDAIALALFNLGQALRRWRAPRSRAATTGRIVLFEFAVPGPISGETPALTIRGARDAIERFIPLAEFGELFGGFAVWDPPAHATEELPGEALGVWSRRTCRRFLRILRERGATVEVRREPGPEQRLRQLARSAGDSRPPAIG